MKLGIAIALLTFGLASNCLGQGTPPNAPLVSIQDRQRYSDVVCSATIVKAYATNSAKQIEGVERSEWIAEARVDRVFKGALDSQSIAFKYYGRVPETTDYFGPAYSYFRSGSRYVLFLRGQTSNLSLTIPFYQMEIEVALSI
jgi:hypothetical protein